MIKLEVNCNEVPVRFMGFSAGERHVIVSDVGLSRALSIVRITAFIQNSDDIIDLLLLKDAVYRMYEKIAHSTLHLLYTPFGRQDRVMNKGESLSIAVFSKLINSMSFDKVIIEDPHSDVQSALLENVEILYQHDIVGCVLGEKIKNEHLLLVSPDAGSMKKTQKLADALNLEPVVIGYKTRDTTTGKISGTGFIGDVSGRDVLIVDDCIDGGYTFIKLGEALKSSGANKVILWVTHGIFSKGVDILDGAIDEVYSKNIWTDNVKNTNNLGILKDL